MNKITLRILTALALVSLSSSLSAGAPTIAYTGYGQLAAEHIASLPLPPKKVFVPKNWFEKTTGIEEASFKPEICHQQTGVQLTYQNFLGTHLDATFKPTVIRKTTYRDLEVMMGTVDKRISLLKRINRTHLPEGEVYLGALLTQPIADRTILMQRQNIVRTLVENTALRTSLNTLFSTIQKNHDALISFWGNEQYMTNATLAQMYYSSEFFTPLNTNSLYQNLVTIDQNITTVALLPSPIAIGALTYPLLKNPTTRYTFQAAKWSAGTALMTYFIYKMITEGIPAQIKQYKYLHQKTIAVQKLIITADVLEKQIHKHPALTDLEHSKVFTDFAKKKRSLSKKMHRLIRLLHTDTFKGEPSFYVLHGRVRVVHALITQLRKDLVPLIVAVAELDAYLSCANLYVEHTDKKNGYCFPEYLEQDTPYLNVTGLWNPFVGADTSVANSIELGGKNPRNVILTGPNAGGKSTFSKGIAIDVLLAQTIGIAPAQSLRFTIFDKINTYMNIGDDTTGGNSLFKSEVLRAQELLTTITDLDKSKFSLSIMDEMFSGTSPKEGEAAGYAVAKNMGSHPHSLAIIATHFPLLKELEKETADFKNYQVRIVRHDDGTFSYPFKLEEGAADQNVAIDILQKEGFASSILQEANAILNRGK